MGRRGMAGLRQTLADRAGSPGEEGSPAAGGAHEDCPAPPSHLASWPTWPPPLRHCSRGRPGSRGDYSPPPRALSKAWPCSCGSWLRAAQAPEELARLQEASSESLRRRKNH